MENPQTSICPVCKAALTIHANLQGKSVRCPMCSAQFVASPPSPAVAFAVVPEKDTKASALQTVSKAWTWLKDTMNRFDDPKREPRIAIQANQISSAMMAKPREFQLGAFVKQLAIFEDDLELVKEQAFKNILARVWSDLRLAPEELKFVTWSVSKLALVPERAKQISWEFGKDAFSRVFAAATEDGIIDDREIQHLNEIAISLGSNLPHLIKSFFREYGESFLRGLFARACESSDQFPNYWNYLLAVSGKLGFARNEIDALVLPQAERLIEHVLADARADDRLSKDEENNIAWLLSQLRVTSNFQRYVLEQLGELRLLTDIEMGKLPSVAVPHSFEIRSGEMVHLHVSQCHHHTHRKTKQGLKTEEHIGDFLLTDARMVFASSTKSFEVNLGNIMQCIKYQDGIEIRSKSKGAGFYFLSNVKLAHLIFTTAVRKWNRTIVEEQDSLPSRHIPQSTRNRVYQLYGGRCAQCSSDQYLEFDHIIPVAKGGSNSEQNVQLLCRGCNLKKSDRI